MKNTGAIFPPGFPGAWFRTGRETRWLLPCSIWNPGENFLSSPGIAVYEGMVVGEHSRDNDLNVNPCKTKKLTNMRASGKDEAVTLTPVLPMTLEKAIQFIREDELVEVTPKVVRIRKSVLLIQERKVVEKRVAA